MNESASALSDPFTSSLAGRRLGRYEVLARLASGGMAAVYVARALGVAGFERLFAIKVLHPHLAHEEEFITMFLDEARLAARIRHPNVVPTIDISDTKDAGYFLVMDYIQGDHLGALLQKAFKLGAKLPAPVSLRIVVDALDGLAAAHNLTDETGRPINLVHRDVSPHNIMVSTDGISCITDFGVAKAEVRLSTTREGQFKGKLAYMSPEHASSGEADRRSDLFSMGIILWESLTGRRLFRAENHAATLNKICLEPIPMPSQVDPSLAPFDHVLQKALARERDERYQSAEEFADAIEQSADTLGGLANQRAVAKLVREYAAEKLARDEELIRTAIAQIGTTPLVSEPAPAGGAAEPGPGGERTGSAFDSVPVYSDQEFASKRNTPALVLTGLVLLAALAVAAVVVFNAREAEDVTAVPLEPDVAEGAAEDLGQTEPEEGAAEQTEQATTNATDPAGEQVEGAGEAARDDLAFDGQDDDGQDDDGQDDDGQDDGQRADREDQADVEREAARRADGRREATRQASDRASRRSAEASNRGSAPRPTPQRVEQDGRDTAPASESTRRRVDKESDPSSAIDDVLLNPYRQKKDD